MPVEEISEGDDIAQRVESVDPITPEIKEMIILVMDHTVEAHYQVGLVGEPTYYHHALCSKTHNSSSGN